jgi:hypothetical protein
MSTNSQRLQRQEKNRRQKLRSNFIWGASVVAVLALIGFVIWQGVRPPMGEAIPIMTSAPHLAPDANPGEYNSDPPTSGLHYATELDAGFYDQNIYTYPAAYLVHNLEHGYVIFWYNCNLLDESACTELKSQIRSVMDEFNKIKMIAYPWDSLDVPGVMTSWGRMLRFESFDVGQARDFYRANLNKAPEPDAP